MFVLTADQIDSRHDVDLAGDALAWISERFGGRLALPPDRNAGDEIQAMTTEAATALDLILALTRDGHWSVGLGWGTMRLPMPAATREASGPAFTAAREAVTRAKNRPLHFAAVAPEQTAGVTAEDSDDLDALLGLLLDLRDRRTESGWEVHDLMIDGGTQRAAAKELGISAAAVGARSRVAGLRVERAALPALVRLMRHLDRTSGSARDRGLAEPTDIPPAAERKPG